MRQKVFNPGRLTKAREKKGLTLRELAKRLVLQPSTLSRWESGDAVPRPQHIKALAAKLGQSQGYFMTYPPRKSEAEKMAEKLLPPVTGGSTNVDSNL